MQRIECDPQLIRVTDTSREGCFPVEGSEGV